MEAVVSIALLALFVAGGVFLIVRYNSLSGRIANTSTMEAAVSFVRIYIREDGILRESSTEAEIENRIGKILTDLNGSNEYEGKLSLAGLGSIEVVDITKEMLGSDNDLFSFRIELSDTISKKEEIIHVVLSTQ